ncbi:MAG: dipeptide/oligopeptide/nickel ABC transporter permease/ATP-binding protein [Micromonosporaceae bacterium]|nr:dipeptide/oligopeptide/nickel ABC transporter permease/ATP-binding protein [Micromonosporaceae bacterium]
MPGVVRRWGAALRTPLGGSAALLLLVVLLLAVTAPILWGGKADTIDTDALSQGPSGAHWLGTDILGRDIFFRILVATRLSVTLALLSTAIGVCAGIFLGALPWLLSTGGGWLGQRMGRMAIATVNIAVAFPGLLLALFLAVIFGVGMTGAVLAIGFAAAPWYARLTQTLVAGIQERDFVAAARIAGLSKPRILLRHILPNIGEPLVVNATVGAGSALLAFAGLSFLGLGVQAPRYDWGLLLSEGLNGIYLRPAGAIAPGVAVVLAGLAFNLFGEVIAKNIGLRTMRPAVSLASRAARIRQAVPQPAASPADPVLVVRDLTVTVPGPGQPVTPVRGVDFTVARGESLGMVGESGSGKSLTALAVAQLLETPLSVRAAALEFLGTDLRTAGNGSSRRLLGTSFGLVFQDPNTSLNPTMKIGHQLAEVARQHQGLGRSLALGRAVERLRDARVPAARRRAGQYPYEFSGGMRQRAMIAMAMMGEPALIVADEPTAALDVTVQRQVLTLLRQIRVERGVALLLISHDITVVSQVCDRVLVVYAGRIVEDLPSAKLHTHARHPYTRALLAAVPDMTADRDQPLATIPGRPVDPANHPVGCAFAARCPRASAECLDTDPALLDDGAGHRVACWHPMDNVDARGESLNERTALR